MSILQSIKKGVANSGSNKGKVVYLKPDSKTRVRFLQEIEDGIEVTMHDHFDRGINSVCNKAFGKKCALCKDSDLRTRSAYAFSVWDNENKEVKIFLGFANNFNPLPALVSMYESYGTMKDRDYILQRDGSRTNTRYSVVPMDKAKFKNSKAKPYSKTKMLEILGKAFPYTEGEDADTDEYEDNDVDIEVDGDEEEVESDYDGMSAKELYVECIERDIDAKKKQKPAYYIELLEQDDLLEGTDNDNDEEDDDDDW